MGPQARNVNGHPSLGEVMDRFSLGASHRKNSSVKGWIWTSSLQSWRKTHVSFSATKFMKFVTAALGKTQSEEALCPRYEAIPSWEMRFRLKPAYSDKFMLPVILWFFPWAAPTRRHPHSTAQALIPAVHQAHPVQMHACILDMEQTLQVAGYTVGLRTTALKGMVSPF